MKSNAIIITGGYYDSINAKTAHGLVRGSDRFNIAAVIDEKSQGKDAGLLLDGVERGIPVVGSISDFVQSGGRADDCIIGVATKGGVIPASLNQLIVEAINAGLNIVNGLHDCVSDHEDLVKLARDKGVKIIDIRKPKKFKDLHFWSGKIKEVNCPVIPVLGTDCALGKRTTTRLLTQAMTNAGFKAEMIYTGQTGWMQGAKYGFIFDATLNDFISGEMEHAICDCYQNERPDIIFIEGQSALRNPSGPAGSEWIISADAAGVVLQHDPVRRQYKDMEYYPALIPALKEEIELIGIYGAPTVAVTLNTGDIEPAEARAFATKFESESGIPTVLPLEDGVDRLVNVFADMINDFRK